MFVGERMSSPVISVTPETPIHDALVMFKKEHIRRAPVIKDGKLVGIVSQGDLLNASPSPVSSLSVWEMNYLISKVTVKQVMTKKVKSIDVNTPIEEAARIMADSKIGGMPVMRSGVIAGMITETDLFKILLELMGAREKAIRVSALVEDKPGQLAKVTKAIADAGGNFVSFGIFSGPDTSSKMLTFKVAGMKKETVKTALEKVVKKFWDIRQS
ncbi:CBS and ACT domain-containing protein [Candidatus Villigracilis affinis]|uniref:CBS and ACT domain-containing protein n=1 Tax=Candidatus Villigracilis affinis TaxID=3140682 RepID=UPI002A1FB5A5|nr:CBS domain-containing protein [Anaerolineales bacterium]